VTKDGSLVEEYQYGPNGTRPYEMNTLRDIVVGLRGCGMGDPLIPSYITLVLNQDHFLNNSSQAFLALAACCSFFPLGSDSLKVKKSQKLAFSRSETYSLCGS
jgi:hypothetical protein